jgi:hypothetical protein
VVAPAVAAAAMLLASSCLYGPDPGISFTEMVTRGRTPGSEWEGLLPWFCRSTGVGGAHGGHGDGLANPAYAGKAKGDLNWDDCAAAADFFDKAKATVMQYPTRGDALAAGANQAVQFVPGLGTHDIVPGVSSTGFDPQHPLFLQYDGAGADAPLAGMSWFVINGDDAHPPEGLPGNNDWWHTHSTLCYSEKGVVVGNEITDEQCAARNGTNRHLPGVWMLHAWIVPGYENQRDVFSGAFMCVRGTGPLQDTEDACTKDTTDPEHAGGDDHGGGATAPTTAVPPAGGDHGAHGH